MNLTQAYPVKFAPIPQERIWGGNKLKSWFGASDIEAPIGEYWVLSGHPNGTSVVVGGDFAGKSLNDIIEMNPKAYLGDSPQPRFPLLIKFLEATTDLSVQIHPDDAYSQKHEGDFGKTEAWYILDCEPGTRVNYGHEFPSQEAYFDAVKNGRVKDYLRYHPVEKDEVVYVPARTLHALLAGTIVVEVQQTSDVTYRVYDWDRVDASGNPRELHVEKAAEVMQYNQPVGDAVVTPEVIERTDAVHHTKLLNCPYFTLEKLELKSAKTLERGHAQNPDVLIVVDGQLELRSEVGTLTLERGDTVLVPTNMNTYELIPSSDSVILRAFY